MGAQGCAVPNDAGSVAAHSDNAFSSVSLPLGDGKYVYLIEHTQDIHSPAFQFNTKHQSSSIVPHMKYLCRVDAGELFLRSIGLWSGVPHPWVNAFVPKSQKAFVLRELEKTKVEDVRGRILLYPHFKSLIGTPNVMLPSEEQLLLFGFLRTAVPPTTERAQDLCGLNDAFSEGVVAVGGKGYVISLRNEHIVYKKHFEERWSILQTAKAKYDPKNILGRGVHFF
eukprot:TRINITY_DN19770_c0_g1_i1.p1 TRINITY_DN19770_c0_g1~~TRINITY_DN19770_c0_g1_i1.p1  ORF type:complete len:225 (-),score=63.08 TRINITY_DN19770_c0_g1_i1:7-681(-)